MCMVIHVGTSRVTLGDPTTISSVIYTRAIDGGLSVVTGGVRGEDIS